MNGCSALERFELPLHRYCPLGLTALLLLAWHAGSAAPLHADQPSFTHDVMAVLSKAGCNTGPCHGNQNGKGGLKLSLWGDEPELDYQRLVRQFHGRRVDLVDPTQSLILLKPTGRLAHQGGVRFPRDSQEYQILHGWMVSGAPGPNEGSARLERLEVVPREQVVIEPEQAVQLTATAFFTDGSQRDVSSLAVYETSNLIATVEHDGLVQRQSSGEVTIMVRYLDQQVPVRLAFVPARPEFVWSDLPANNYIDEHGFAKLRTLRINPSAPADEHVFVRRAFLDALGVLPTAEEARAFVADPRPDKRAALIENLLARPELAEHWALKWSDLLRNEEKVLDSRGVEVFYGWIRDSIARNKPLDQFVRELVTGRGSTYENPPANFYRANRDPATRGETTARLFLGVRLQCAKCHNHPFDRWTQDDYYSWTANFARIDYEIVENERRDKFDKNEFVGEQIVQVKDEGEVQNARTGKNAVPQFLGGEAPALDAEADRLEPLARWLTDGHNQLFVRAQVNWIWYHLMGRGLVEPIDDFRATNPPINPPLLEALCEDYVAHGFDLRHLIRRIMNSQLYQLSAVPNETNAEDEENFSRAVVRRLPAEKLLDAQSQVLDAPATFAGYDPGIRAGQLPGVRKEKRRGKPPTEGDRFLSTFGKPERLLACECERSDETTLAQAFMLIGSQGIQQRLAQSGNRLERLAQSEQSAAEAVDQLYWAALSRPPSDEELQVAVGLLESDQDRFAALQDLAWALINAKEFVFRR